MAFTLPPLGYDYAALEPHIDARTMEIHHTKHHQAYVNNLNAAIEKTPELQDKSLEWLLQNLPAVPESVRNAVRNNAGGHWNHTFFWQIIGPNGGGEPTTVSVLTRSGRRAAKARATVPPILAPTRWKRSTPR